MKPLPLFISTAISAALQIAYQVMLAILLYFTYTQAADALTDMLGEPASYLGSPIMIFSYAISCLGCFLAPLAYTGTGLVYAYLHQREGHLTLEDGALGGALAGAAARLSAGMLGILVDLGVNWLTAQQMLGTVPMGYPVDILSITMIGNLLGSLPGLCFGILIAAVLGGVGGLLGGNAFRSRYSE